jgi:hypothetical protein
LPIPARLAQAAHSPARGSIGFMPATATEYDWFHLLFPELARAYCLTLVRGINPWEVLERLGATGDLEKVTGVSALIKAADVSPGFMGVTSVGNWALGIEPDGTVGTTEARVRRLSEATRLVSHSRDTRAADRFCWLEKGTARLCFEPLFPDRRWGSEAHEYVDLMRAVGFRMDPSDEYRQGVQASAAFALAEELTGVLITPELLDNAPFECAVIPR